MIKEKSKKDDVNPVFLIKGLANGIEGIEGDDLFLEEIEDKLRRS